MIQIHILYSYLCCLDRPKQECVDTNVHSIDQTVKPHVKEFTDRKNILENSKLQTKKQKQLEKYIAKKLKKDERPKLLERLASASFSACEVLQSSTALLVPRKRTSKKMKVQEDVVSGGEEEEEDDDDDDAEKTTYGKQKGMHKPLVHPAHGFPLIQESDDFISALRSLKKSLLNPLDSSNSEQEEEEINESFSSKAEESTSFHQSTLPKRETTFVLVNRKPEIEEQRLKLPIYAEEQKIMETILNHPVTLICGETGSGKTTQVPQFLYEAGFGADCGLIGVTQPRRIAAMSMSRRVGEELDQPTHVGYQVRYDATTVTSDTRIKFMTDGILLRELQDDFLLQKYSILLLDEVHERNLNTDVLIGMLSRVVRTRNEMSMQPETDIKPLRLVIMSATLNIDEFMTCHLFGCNPPLIKVDARQHPVTVHFARRTEEDYVLAAYKTVRKIHANLPPGGILVFLTGKQEISKLANKLLKKQPQWIDEVGEEDVKDKGCYCYDDEILEKDMEEEEPFEFDADELFDLDLINDTREPLHVLPLYSLLAPEEQAKVFQTPPEGHRLCVIATNVAETSLTIPNIRYVVDSGRVKERHYDPSTASSLYQVEWCSKASATQRAGRAGRMGPGHCYRLYSSAVFEREFAEFAKPEIFRSSVDGLVLQLMAMGIDKPENFPLPSAPSSEAIKAAQISLNSLKAVVKSDGDEWKITKLGRLMNRLPLSPVWSRMVVISAETGSRTMLTVAMASVLSVGDPFLDQELSNQVDKNKESSKILKVTREEWAGKPNNGDMIMWLRIFLSYISTPSRDRRSFCAKQHVMPKRMEEMHQQLYLLIRALKSTYNNQDFNVYELAEYHDRDFEWVRKLLTQSLVNKTAEHTTRRTLVNSKRVNLPCYRLLSRPDDDPSAIVFLHPSSVMIDAPPKFLVYSELAVIDKVPYLKYVAPVEAGWLQE